MIRKVKVEDAQSIVDIYNYYILNTNISFEVEPLKSEEMAERIKNISSKFPYIVYEEAGKVLGYAYLSEYRTRVAYKFTVESSIYLDKDAKGNGIGQKLYEELIEKAKVHEFHTIIGCVTIPNEPSTKLHERLGFEKIAHFKEAGFKNNTWLDVGYWQRIIYKDKT